MKALRFFLLLAGSLELVQMMFTMLDDPSLKQAIADAAETASIANMGMIATKWVMPYPHGPGHEGAAVLLPGFAMW